MSDNTNTLFWIIVGAIVIIAIYILINSNISSAITGIFNHFGTLWTDTSKG